MPETLSGYIRAWVRGCALEKNRLVGLYRRICRPVGAEWAQYLQRFGGLQAIGEGCVINMNVTITDPAFVRLGRNVHLSGCTLFGHDGSVNMINQAYGLNLDRVGKIDIRDNVFIGHQAIVLPGVTIGPDAIVAANAVVTHDVPPGTVVGGAPARVLCTLDNWIARVQKANESLPWAAEFAKRRHVLEPESPVLRALRVQAFFGGAGHDC
ncbi:acyltransferase [Chitinilyticum piscinae]|uniref:Acyltransferase n=1 Tax=Chitinilyticum piscinae TaxID=2866724 RepID=A0A8J7FRJ1_9NEIS|nr:acyltransferase [Chitinilyticum piscinae]MBE9609561.1 acyltransferase [Chitinilyticum piscinae]